MVDFISLSSQLLPAWKQSSLLLFCLGFVRKSFLVVWMFWIWLSEPFLIYWQAGAFSMATPVAKHLNGISVVIITNVCNTGTEMSILAMCRDTRLQLVLHCFFFSGALVLNHLQYSQLSCCWWGHTSQASRKWSVERVNWTSSVASPLSFKLS